MLTPYLPYPPSSGGQVRSYNLIKNLGRKHQITLFSLIKKEAEKKYVSELEKFCQKVSVFRRPPKPWSLTNIFKAGFGIYPFLVVRNLSEEERKAIQKELAREKFDLIHAETFYVMPHLPQTDTPVLLVEQTIEYQVYLHYARNFRYWPLKPLLHFDVAKLKYWETKFWKEANRVVAVSRADEEKMLALVPGLNVDIVPNGVGEDLIGIWGERKAPKRRPIVFFQGNFSWIQNTEAAEILVKEVFPLIKKQIPEVICWIVGQEAGRVKRLAGDGVEVMPLSESDVEGVKKAYRESSVLLAPLKGPGGTRLKILGAMAAGLPVVTTKIGIEGIKAKTGVECLVRETSKGMAQAVITLLKNKKLYEKIKGNARKLVIKEYDWQKIAIKLDHIYQEVSDEKS
jgi:glycosyltransferase involved in cell wall biosynthesis